MRMCVCVCVFVYVGVHVCAYSHKMLQVHTYAQKQFMEP